MRVVRQAVPSSHGPTLTQPSPASGRGFERQPGYDPRAPPRLHPRLDPIRPAAHPGGGARATSARPDPAASGRPTYSAPAARTLRQPRSLLDAGQGCGRRARHGRLGRARTRRSWLVSPPCWGTASRPGSGSRAAKGIATGAGVLLAWSWPAGLLCLLVWLAAAFLSKRSSVGCPVRPRRRSAPALGLSSMAGPRWPVVLVSAVCIFRHHANIARLLAGTEPRIGQKG